MKKRAEIIDDILILAINEIVTDKDVFHRLKNKIYKEHKIAKPIPSIEFLERYNILISKWLHKDNPDFRKLLRKRWVRSLSWVSVISLLTKAYPCPWKCIYCPSFEWLPKSYIPNEPAVLRAELNNFSPILQIHNRLRALEVTWHIVEKNDLRIIWWTWTCYSKEYKDEYIKDSYDALNSYEEMKSHIERTDLSNEKFASFTIKKWYTPKKSNTLEEAKKTNETAHCRAVGLQIETRPDLITEEEIIWLRKYWITRVEIGYQTTDDEINKLNKRWHWIKESIHATKLLKDAWFKVVAHMMQNLLGSTPKIDLESMEDIFKCDTLRPDEIKIYPMVATLNSELEQIWRNWGFTAYDDETLIELMCNIHEIVPEYVRINRTYRDIPANDILAWSTLSNLRQVVEARMLKEWRKMQDIRSREIKWKINDPKNAILHEISYEASEWKEHFLTFEDPEDRTIFSLLRLRIPSQYYTKEKHFINELEWSSIIRELHTFWEQVSIWNKWWSFWQHIWFWKKLIEAAERITKNQYKLNKISIISAVWTRQYYEKRWYKLEGEYMTKNI